MCRPERGQTGWLGGDAGQPSSPRLPGGCPRCKTARPASWGPCESLVNGPVMALGTCSAVPSSFSHALLAWQLSRAALSVPCPLPASSTASMVSVEWPPRGSGGPSRVMCGQPSAGASLVSQPGLSDGQPTGQPVSQDTATGARCSGIWELRLCPF